MSNPTYRLNGVIALLLIWLVLVFSTGQAAAHSGGLAKDGCHKHKAAGERHWHVEGTRTRGGPCVKHDGETYLLTTNAVCAKTRIRISDLRESYWGGNADDWERAATNMVDCVIELGPDK